MLGASGDRSRLHFACRLAEKAYRLKNTVHVLTTDQQTAEKFDELLWTYNDGSFVPHEIAGDNSSNPEAPVTSSHEGSPRDHADLLINLTGQVVAQSATFPRVAEIVTSDDNSRQQSRQRYAEYRDMGHTLETHKL